MVVVDDFTKYTWVILLRSKSDAPKHIETFVYKTTKWEEHEDWSNS